MEVTLPVLVRPICPSYAQQLRQVVGSNSLEPPQEYSIMIFNKSGVQHSPLEEELFDDVKKSELVFGMYQCIPQKRCYVNKSYKGVLAGKLSL